MTTGVGLPPGAEMRDGRVVRRLKVMKDGKERTVFRSVAFTLKEAKETGADYFDQQLGWIRAGRKTEMENPLPAAIDTMIRRRVEVDDADESED